MSTTPRREFLVNAAKAGMGVWIGSNLLSSCATSHVVTVPSVGGQTGFQQTPLPYAYNALTNAIDAQTMEIHYSKHAAAYAANLQDAVKVEGVNTSGTVEDVLQHISRYSMKMRNNGGGHYNHELFWKLMSPNGGQPAGNLLNAINSSFGSLEAFQKQFTDAGMSRFGSGWSWLVVDGDKRLRIGSTPNQDNPLMDISDFKGFPLLGLDVWEHAYYLRYQNKRAEYIANWWKVVNWNYVQERFASAV
ncbi:MAG: superoxide dismutase [Flavisolibacter sp.]